MSDPIPSLQQITVADPGSQVIAVLLAGLLMAFGFQLLVAILKAIVWLIASPSSIRKQWFNNADFGLITAINLALFPASFLAVKLSRIEQPLLGAIAGLVLWSAYFLILTWLSSQALGNILQTVLGLSLEAVRELFEAISRLFRRQPTVTEDQVKTEIQSALADFDLDSRIQTYLAELPPVQFDLKPIEEMMRSMLALPTLQSLAGQQLLKAVDLHQLGQLLKEQDQYSDREVAQILDQLEPLWHGICCQAAKQNSASELVKQLVASNNNTSKSESALSDRDRTDLPDMLLTLLDRVDADALFAELLDRVDLSEWDVARLWQQFQRWCQQLTGKAVEPLTVLPKDVEHYLLSAASWEVNPQVLAEDIPELFFDPEADPVEMSRQLDLLNLDSFARILRQRGDLALERVKALASQLESLRRVAVARCDRELETQRLNQLGQAFKLEIESLSPEEIATEQLTHRLDRLLDSISSETILALCARLDLATLSQWLQDNNQLPSETLTAASSALLNCIQARAAQIESKLAKGQIVAGEIETKLAAYLTYTSLDKLTDAAIRQKLYTLVEEASVQPDNLYRALPHLEGETLQDILNRRQGLKDDRRGQIVVLIQACWQEQVPEPAAIKPDAQSLTQRLEATLEEIVQASEVEQLSLEDLKPQVLALIRDPALEFNTLTEELAQVDWSPLQVLLDEVLSDADRRREFLEWLQEQLFATARRPRRYASRQCDRELHFKKRIDRYLTHHPKDTLTPESMRRDLKKMLQEEVKRAPRSKTGEPAVSIEQAASVTIADVVQETSLSLPQLPTEEAISSTLCQRDDITPTEREQIFVSLQTAWQEVNDQFQLANQQAMEALTALWENLASAVNALQLSDAELERIERELDNLLAPFTDSFNRLSETLNLWLPDAPLKLLRHRLAAWNEADSTQLKQSSTAPSLSVYRHVQAYLDDARLQLDRELAALEKEAHKQLDDIRKAAAKAATWLFGLALSSALCAALAGFLAV